MQATSDQQPVFCDGCWQPAAQQIGCNLRGPSWADIINKQAPMTHTVVLELASSSDSATIAELSRNLVEDGLPWSWTPQRVTGHTADASSIVLCARVGEALAGFAIMRFFDERAHLNLLGVDPRYQGRGLGTKMLHWLEGSAHVAGAFQITLEVRSLNARARAFYAERGYVEVKHMPGYYFGRESAIRMFRDLRVASACRY